MNGPHSDTASATRAGAHGFAPDTGRPGTSPLPPEPGEQRSFWWFNVRPSNTEPLLRLNVEGGTPEQMAAIRDEVLALIRA